MCNIFISDILDIWTLLYVSNHFCLDVDTIQKNIIDHVEYTLARTKHNFDSFAAYQATAYSYVLARLSLHTSYKAFTIDVPGTLHYRSTQTIT